MLEEWIEKEVPAKILVRYWNSQNDHDDLRKIIKCLDQGQLVDIPKIFIALHDAGFMIVRTK